MSRLTVRERLRPGRLLLALRQLHGDGLAVTYHRDIVRRRILNTAPVNTGDDRCEIHVLTSRDDWLNLLWALKSFYWATGRSYRLCIHDDGSLKGQILSTLMFHFPNSRLISRKEADATVLPALASHPRCLDFRRRNHLSPKVFDFAHYLEADRMLLLDSDVLFFEEPTELLRRIENLEYRKNSVNPDVASAYTVRPDDAKKLANVDLIDRFNSGLGLIHRESLRLDWIEEFLSLPGIMSHFWRIEQTLYALCSSRWGAELLPEEYAVYLDDRPPSGPVRHYVGAVRNLMYRQGIPRLIRAGMLRGGT